MKFNFKEMFKSDAAELAKLKEKLRKTEYALEMEQGINEELTKEIRTLQEKLKYAGIIGKLKKWWRL